MIEIRELSSEHIEQLVELQEEVYPNDFNVKLGKYFTKSFFKWFYSQPYHKGLVALIEDKAIGYLLGYPYLERRLLDKYLSKTFFKSLLKNPFLIFKKDVSKKLFSNFKRVFLKKGLKSASEVFDIDLSKAYYMFVIAIKPSARGQNLGRQLMLKMEELAMKDRFRYFIGSVAVENEKVLRMWSTIGYKVYNIDEKSIAKYVFKDANAA